ncbi:MAG: tRNA lysidine(34) synthetase TilS [Firmicutes bacterium]|nr:tRNA lysidine(34) synthetase TilS [Bacillota bacterium]
MNLLRKTAEYIQEKKLILPNQSVVAAFSAGQDSRVLLDILCKLRETLGFSVAAAHFNHQLRPESQEEQFFAQSVAKEYGVPFFCGTAQISALAQGKNLQEVARRERYAFLRRTARQTGAQYVATAHHAGDQAETVLLHLLRGAGLSGLSAMQPLTEDVIRPLLFASQADIAAYAAENGLTFCQDQSNFSDKYLRNRIRWQLLPALKNYNPQIVEALNATADICGEEDRLLDDMAENALAELWLVEDTALSGPEFDRLPRALQRRVLRKAFYMFAGEKAELSFGQTQAIIDLKDEQRVALPGGAVAYRRRHVYFDRKMPPLPVHAQTIPLQADDKWHVLADWGWRYRAVPAKLLPARLPVDTFWASASEWPQLCFRTRRQGDGVPSQGKKGKKKLKDVFIEAKLPGYVKNSWPLLTNGDGEIIWVPFLYRRAAEPPADIILIKIAKDDIIN